MNNVHSFFARLYHSPIPRRAAATLVVVGLSGLAFGGEIHDAARDGNLENVKALLNDHPDLIFSKDNEHGWTPLHWAAVMGHKGMMELLLAHGAEVNVHEAAAGGLLEKVKALLKDNPDVVFSKDSNGATPLQVAAGYGHRDVAELLLASQADVNAKNPFGQTPLHWAAVGGHKDVAALLLANEADVNAKDKKGDTPLHGAASRGHKDVMEVLLANKAEVNANAKDGSTPLHWAAWGGHKAVAVLLLANKAEVNAKDLGGMTPLSWAKRRVDKDMVDLLRQHGGHE